MSKGRPLEYFHQPVLVEEVVKYLVGDPDGVYVDGTVGTGGHGLAVGKILGKKGRLICLDRDPDVTGISKERLAFLGDRVEVFRANYGELDIILHKLGIERINGVLLDLGMSSYQLEKSGRGFSFGRNEPLDMRMNPGEGHTASYLVNHLPQRDLERVLKEYGEERRAKSISRAILRARRKKPIETSTELAVLVESLFSTSRGYIGKHPATRTFQALRIAVNRELENLEIFLEKIPWLLASGGRLVILSYHSLEDRIVKRTIAGWEKPCVCPPDLPLCVCGKAPLFKRLLKKGVRPRQQEIDQNPRARSAVMRVAERMMS